MKDVPSVVINGLRWMAADEEKRKHIPKSKRNMICGEEGPRVCVCLHWRKMKTQWSCYSNGTTREGGTIRSVLICFTMFTLLFSAKLWWCTCAPKAHRFFLFLVECIIKLGNRHHAFIHIYFFSVALITLCFLLTLSINILHSSIAIYLCKKNSKRKVYRKPTKFSSNKSITQSINP